MVDFNAIVGAHATAQLLAAEADHDARQALAEMQMEAAKQTFPDWDIHRGRWPEPAWRATHKDYDASWEGEEDGYVDNGLSCDAPTLGGLLDEIECIQAEHPHFKSQPATGAPQRLAPTVAAEVADRDGGEAR